MRYPVNKTRFGLRAAMAGGPPPAIAGGRREPWAGGARPPWTTGARAPWAGGARAGWLAMAGRGHRHHHGHGPWGGRGGFPFPFGAPGFGRGPRARRGDVRAALLVLLDEEPRNGYQLIQEIEQRSGGLWKPSPGSVYPALQQLEDEGLVRAEEVDGRRTFRLTDAGARYVDARRDELGAPWEAVTGGVDQGLLELRNLVMQLGGAALQVAQAGSPAQVDEAKQVIADARRALYRILADGDPGGERPEQV